ncbi:OmpA family protein [Yersinia similis]|uniref:OmpA domain-containing protein n=1 Tax=Yersinia similis TaxID=367190 RepID=A0A0T9R2T1_9GAMM|nr:OmpA family protein [Yersinia similis]CNG10688.1 OmpA domain-containing protein [Yersinia similis]CNI40425.1 OmpA domain-containing protein [Yersinia similis]
MRKSAIVSGMFHIFISAAVLLWLLWYFFPVAIWVKGLVTLVIVMVAYVLVRRRPDAVGTLAASDLPLIENQSPVVLVCGDGLGDLFPEQPLRKTGQGCWLRVGDVSALTDVVRNIQAQQPRQLGQLSIMYSCLLDQHQDEAVLRASLKVLRQQVRQLHLLTGFRLPVVLNCQFSGPETPWNIVRGDEAVVCPSNEALISLQEWQLTAGNSTSFPVLGQAFTFIREILLDELEKMDRLCPPVHPFAVALRTGYPRGENNSLWVQWLHRRTALQLPQTRASFDTSERFPDAILPLLSPYALPVQGGQASRRVVWLLMLCALGAIGFSVTNNRNLIHQVGADLQRWHTIPMTHYAPKAQALTVLQQDTLLLERWQRQGEPLKYSLGLYPGQRLWLTLQQAIDTYIPPPPPPVEKKIPQTVRLDSLSLFDVGKFQLKPGSIKMLVDALMNIRAKPGWLIVVAGHTDITGDAQANHILSLKRAEALRDWMLSTSDVSPTCFAVQGYGATRPIADNDTPDGRAANRRVEISLVPQADACQVPDVKTASQDESDVSTQEMEK